MAIENKRPFIPELPPKKEVSVNPEKSAKKLYSDATFTISKLTERADRSIREIDGLTSLRQERERIHSYGDITSGENAKLQAETENIKNKLNKSKDELIAATEAYSKLDKDLSDLGVVADNPMRLTIAQNRDFWAKTLARIDARIAIEANITEHSARQVAVREALRGVKPQQKSRPFTETVPELDFKKGVTSEQIAAYETAASRDLEGVITEDQVKRANEWTDEQDRLAEVSPARSEAEMNKRKKEQEQVRGYYKNTTSGSGQYYATSHKGEFPGTIDFQNNEDTIADNAARVAQEKQAEALSKINFESIGITLSDIAESIAPGKIDSIEKLQTALNTPELIVALNELIPEKNHGKDILEFVGKKARWSGKREFDNETARSFIEKLVTAARDRAISSASETPSEKKPGFYQTVSKENLVKINSSKDEFNGDFADATPEEVLARNKAAELAEAEEEAKLHKPEFAKYTTTLSGKESVRLATAHDKPYNIDDTDEKSNAEYKAMKEEAIRQSREGKADTAKQIYEVAAEHLKSVQDRIRSGEIDSVEELEEALNRTPRISYQDLLPAQVRYTTKIKEAVSTKSGFFRSKFTFDKVLANDFVNDLRKSALNNSEKTTRGE